MSLEAFLGGSSLYGPGYDLSKRPGQTQQGRYQAFAVDTKTYFDEQKLTNVSLEESDLVPEVGDLMFLCRNDGDIIPNDQFPEQFTDGLTASLERHAVPVGGRSIPFVTCNTTCLADADMRCVGVLDRYSTHAHERRTDVSIYQVLVNGIASVRNGPHKVAMGQKLYLKHANDALTYRNKGQDDFGQAVPIKSRKSVIYLTTTPTNHFFGIAYSDAKEFEIIKNVWVCPVSKINASRSVGADANIEYAKWVDIFDSKAGVIQKKGNLSEVMIHNIDPYRLIDALTEFARRHRTRESKHKVDEILHEILKLHDFLISHINEGNAGSLCHVIQLMYNFKISFLSTEEVVSVFAIGKDHTPFDQIRSQDFPHLFNSIYYATVLYEQGDYNEDTMVSEFYSHIRNITDAALDDDVFRIPGTPSEKAKLEEKELDALVRESSVRDYIKIPAFAFLAKFLNEGAGSTSTLDLLRFHYEVFVKLIVFVHFLGDGEDKEKWTRINALFKTKAIDWLQKVDIGYDEKKSYEPKSITYYHEVVNDISRFMKNSSIKSNLFHVLLECIGKVCPITDTGFTSDEEEEEEKGDTHEILDALLRDVEDAPVVAGSSDDELEKQLRDLDELEQDAVETSSEEETRSKPKPKRGRSKKRVPGNKRTK